MNCEISGGNICTAEARYIVVYASVTVGPKGMCEKYLCEKHKESICNTRGIMAECAVLDDRGLFSNLDLDGNQVCRKCQRSYSLPGGKGYTYYYCQQCIDRSMSKLANSLKRYER